MIGRILSRGVRRGAQIRAHLERDRPIRGISGSFPENGFSAAATVQLPATTNGFSSLPQLRSDAQHRPSASHGSKGSSLDHQTSGIAYLHSALGLATEHALVSRLATIWQIPAECLMAQVQAVQNLLQPCGLNSTAHALWVLVRCEELRSCSEHQLRISFRKLQQVVSHLDLDRATLLAAIYKRPWMLAAMMPAQPPPAAAAAVPAASPQPASWKQELAAFLLEVQQHSNDSNDSSSSNSGDAATAAPGNSGSSSRSSMTSSPLLDAPLLPLTAVKTYLTAKEASRAIRSAFSRLPTFVFPKSSSTSTSSGSTAATATPTGGAARGTNSTTPHCREADSHHCEQRSVHHHHQQQQRQHQHQHQQQDFVPVQVTPDAPCAEAAAAGSGAVRNDQLLQQLLACYPQAMQVPPDLLLSRWQMLVAGLLGGTGAAVNSHDSAAQLVMTCPYLLFDYTDYAQGSGNGSRRAEVLGSDYL